MNHPTDDQQKRSSRLWYLSIPLFLVFEISRRLGYGSYASVGLILIIAVVISASLVRPRVQKHKVHTEKKVEAVTQHVPESKPAATPKQPLIRELLLSKQGMIALLILVLGITAFALALHYRGPKYSVCKADKCEEAIEVSDPLKYCVNYLRADGYRAEECGKDVRVIMHH